MARILHYFTEFVYNVIVKKVHVRYLILCTPGINLRRTARRIVDFVVCPRALFARITSDNGLAITERP